MPLSASRRSLRPPSSEYAARRNRPGSLCSLLAGTSDRDSSATPPDGQQDAAAGAFSCKAWRLESLRMRTQKEQRIGLVVKQVKQSSTVAAVQPFDCHPCFGALLGPSASDHRHCHHRRRRWIPTAKGSVRLALCAYTPALPAVRNFLFFPPPAPRRIRSAQANSSSPPNPEETSSARLPPISP